VTSGTLHASIVVPPRPMHSAVCYVCMYVCMYVLCMFVCSVHILIDILPCMYHDVHLPTDEFIDAYIYDEFVVGRNLIVK
jgi:hypothetical protein